MTEQDVLDRLSDLLTPVIKSIQPLTQLGMDLCQAIDDMGQQGEDVGKLVELGETLLETTSLLMQIYDLWRIEAADD